jgi:glycosyltransferase involved in cell wall biosynthesis
MRMMFAARAMDNMAGGVERMIIAIMNEMARRGHEVALFSWDHAQANAFYPLHPRVQWFKLDLGNPGKRANLGLRLKRVPKVRRIVKAFAPDVIVGFQGGAFRPMAFYTLGYGIPVVAAERTAPSLYEHAGTERKRQIELFSFRFARTITVQFDRYRSGYPSYLQDKIVETPNPVAVASRQASPGAPSADGRYTLLSVGRLSYQKNYDVLLKAFALLADRFPDWDLRIVGEGEDRPKLETMIASMPALQGRVVLPGATQDVTVQYAAAQLFCLPSRWEGFPNALAEALAHGLPSVGFENCSGVPDLIAEGQSGVMALAMNDANSLAEALAQLMSDPQARMAKGQYAIESMQRYSPDHCFDRWENVLLEAGA